MGTVNKWVESLAWVIWAAMQKNMNLEWEDLTLSPDSADKMGDIGQVRFPDPQGPLL